MKNRPIEINEFIEELFVKYGLEDWVISRIKGLCETVEMEKGKFFLENGMSCNKIAILLRGILYAYSFDQSGEKRISRFFYLPENPIVVDLESFSNNTSSEEYIECIESAHLLVISKGNLYDLYSEIPRLNEIGRILAEESYIKALRKIKLFQTSNGKQRIELLMEQAPELFVKVSRSYIASYLGMHRNTYDKAFKQII